jgi:hypothetical protein
MNDEAKLKLLTETLGQSKDWIATYFLSPKYNKELLGKINELQGLLDIYNWNEQSFYYTPLPPKSTGLPYLVLIPDLPLEGNAPYVLIAKKNLKSHSKREDYTKIELTDLDKVNGKLKIFIDLNLDLIIFHWAQLIDSIEVWRELRKI